MEIKETLAAILVDTSKPLVLDCVRLPERLQPGQVLVKLITSGICGAQINEIDAAKGPDKFLPHLLGHEGYAKVLETGPSVTKLQPGNQVVLHWRPSSGIQSPTPTYLWGSRIVNAGWVTTFNEYAIVSENRLTKVNPSMDIEFMPLLGCALTTALGVLENDAGVSHRDSLLITGFGGVGNALLQFSRHLGVRNITVVDTDPHKAEEALRLGADKFVLFTSKKETQIQLENHFALIGKPTVAVETSGNISAIEICYETTHDQGRVVLVGVPRNGNNASIHTLPLHFGKSITGSKGGNSNPETDIPFILELLDSGKISRKNFPTKNFDFKQINHAVDDLRSGVSGRIVLTF